MPRILDAIAFEFDTSVEGWLPAHDMADLTTGAGLLRGTITGPDPYIVRTNLEVDGDACPVILLRMRITAGAAGQFFWTTESSPQFDEAKSVQFNPIADGQFHEYRLSLAQHAQWSGERITAIRLDPEQGAPSCLFELDCLGAGQ